MRWAHWAYTIPLRLRSVFRRDRVEHDLEDEIRFHLERQIAEDVARGLTAEEARNAAVRAFGGIEQRKEECRDARRVRFVEEFRQNLRFALRRLRSSPGLTTSAVITLALGIGANTIVFTAIDTLLFRPLPVQAADRLVFFNNGAAVSFSYPAYRDFRDHNDVLAGMTAYRVVPMNIGASAAGNFRTWGYEATGNYFGLLGVKPFLGRLFDSEDDTRPGAHPVLVLSYLCWQRRFGADANIVGRTVKVNGLDYTILGVTTARFRGTETFFNPDLWVPMSMQAQIEPGDNWLESRATTNVWMLGRLKDEVSRRQAEESLNRIAVQLVREYPATDEGMTIQLSAPGLAGNALRGPVTGFAAALMGIAGLVLLLACFNLAGMLLARAADRRKEIAVRLALGASRARLVRQLLTESLLLAAGGGAAGLLLSAWLAGQFNAWQPPFDLPVNTTLVMDARALLFAFLTALFATLLFGVAPALQTSRPDLVRALKNETISERLRRWHLRDVLVSAQVTLSVVLLISSLLVVRSLQHALRLNLGFDPERAVSVSFDLGLEGYSEDRGRTFQRAALARVSALPAIVSAGAIDHMPLRFGMEVDAVSIVGRPLPASDRMPAAVIYSVSPGYLTAAGTRLLSGRDIDAHDRSGSPRVALVNATFTRTVLQGEEAIGKRFRFGRPPSGDPIEIIGVVEDGRYQSLGEDPTPAVFAPLSQRYRAWTTVVARTSLPPDEAVRAIRSAVLQLDPALTLFNAGNLKDQLALPLFPVRVAVSVLGAFGLIAIVLSATGVFALVAYAVSRRTREIGIRMAMGATRGQVSRAVFARTIALWTAGSFLGTVIALAASRILSAMLYGVSPRDPVAYGLALMLMATASLLACWYPAYRAMRVNPALTLRQE